jgi:hypothetical protein
LKYFLFLFILIKTTWLCAQTYSEESKLFTSLKLDDALPTNLLASRSVVLYDPSVPEADLNTVQKAFQQTGIDAVVYFETARCMAGVDARKAATRYLTIREIKFLVLLRKLKGQYEFYFTEFNGKADLIEPNQQAWFVHNSNLNVALKNIFQQCISNQKKQNFLINDLPEFKTQSPIVGRRNETLVVDIGYFSVAFPRFGDDSADKELEHYLKENYTGKYELVDSKIEESELVKRRFLYALRYLHTQGALAKSMLGYEVTKAENTIASTTFVEGQLQLKTIAAEEEVYKFYFKNVETGEVFLGKWDADITWQDALKNHINAYKAERKLK